MSRSSNQKLREAVAKAYSEGWSDGANHGNLPYKYPPHRVAWLRSNTREAYYPMHTKAQHDELLAWEDGTYGQREEIANTPEAEGLEP